MVMSYNGYVAHIEYDQDDELFIGHIAGIQDRVGFHADTVDDLKAAFYEAVDDYIQTCAQIGKEPEKQYTGKVMFRWSPETHRKAALAAEVTGQSLTQWTEDVIGKAAESLVQVNATSSKKGTKIHLVEELSTLKERPSKGAQLKARNANSGKFPSKKNAASRLTKITSKRS